MDQYTHTPAEDVVNPRFDGTMTDEQIRSAQNLAADGSRKAPEFTRPQLQIAAEHLRKIGFNDPQVDYVCAFVEAFFTHGAPTKYHVPEPLRMGQPLPGESLATPGKVKGWNACRQAIIRAAKKGNANG